METVIPKQAIERAKAHEFLRNCVYSVERVTFNSAEVALQALREDVQEAISEVAKREDARFWFEVFGLHHSTCKYSISGFCDAYRPNDGSEVACSYAYVHDVECCVCIRTKATEGAYPEVFPELGDGLDTKGNFYGGAEPTERVAQSKE